MKLVKVLYKRKIDKEIKVVPSYFIEGENGQRVLIKPVNKYDYQVLGFLSVFGGFKDLTKEGTQDESSTNKDIQK